MAGPIFTGNVDILIMVIGGLFTSQIGLLVWLLKKYSEVVDKHKEILPSIVRSLELIDKNLNGLLSRMDRMDVVTRENERVLNEMKGALDTLLTSEDIHKGFRTDDK
jgi:hypothetical protein